jgi:Family of unknown function (DUF6283)
VNEPCRTCPWRRSSTIGGSDIPGFSLDLMRGLETCVGDTDAFRPIMACHYSPCGEERPCVGYLASEEGYHNLAVRLGAARGRWDLSAILLACEGIDRWESFGEMLSAYEEGA